MTRLPKVVCPTGLVPCLMLICDTTVQIYIRISDIRSLEICDSRWYLSNELCVFYRSNARRLKTHNSLYEYPSKSVSNKFD